MGGFKLWTFSLETPGGCQLTYKALSTPAKYHCPIDYCLVAKKLFKLENNYNYNVESYTLEHLSNNYIKGQKKWTRLTWVFIYLFIFNPYHWQPKGGLIICFFTNCLLYV